MWLVGVVRAEPHAEWPESRRCMSLDPVVATETLWEASTAETAPETVAESADFAVITA